MAHELTQRENGFVEMAYCGDAPWHKLGQELTQGASIDECGKSLEEAQEWCEREDTHGDGWFDGYREE